MQQYHHDKVRGFRLLSFLISTAASAQCNLLRIPRTFVRSGRPKRCAFAPVPWKHCAAHRPNGTVCQPHIITDKTQLEVCSHAGSPSGCCGYRGKGKNRAALRARPRGKWHLVLARVEACVESTMFTVLFCPFDTTTAAPWRRFTMGLESSGPGPWDRPRFEWLLNGIENDQHPCFELNRKRSPCALHLSIPTWIPFAENCGQGAGRGAMCFENVVCGCMNCGWVYFTNTQNVS